MNSNLKLCTMSLRKEGNRKHHLNRHNKENLVLFVRRPGNHDTLAQCFSTLALLTFGTRYFFVLGSGQLSFSCALWDI